MTIHVSQDVERSIDAAVQSGEFASADEMVSTLVREYAQRTKVQPTAGQPHPDPAARKPIWERAAELRDGVPAEEWARVPVDGASQHDHYIYGTPKRSSQ